MITSDGKIFGKLNILDIIIFAAVIAGGIFFLTRDDTPLTTVIGGGATSVYTMSFFVPLTDTFVADPINVGDAVVQHGTELSFGTVINIEKNEGLEFHPNAEGVLVGSQWGDRVEMEITSQITLPQGALDNGLMIHGNRFAIGQSVTIRVGDSVIPLRISGLSEVN